MLAYVVCLVLFGRVAQRRAMSYTLTPILHATAANMGSGLSRTTLSSRHRLIACCRNGGKVPTHLQRHRQGGNRQSEYDATSRGPCPQKAAEASALDYEHLHHVLTGAQAFLRWVIAAQLQRRHRRRQ